MKKREYLSPEMEVVELKHHTVLLAGSAGSEIAPGTDESIEFAPGNDLPGIDLIPGIDNNILFQ